MVLYRLAALLNRLLVGLLFRPRVRGREHVPASGGLVLAPSHLSAFDPQAVAYALGLRPLRNMAKNQLFRHPLLGPIVRALGGFPAYDGDGLAGGVSAAVAFARAGQAVVIFPEGRRRRPESEHRPRTGAARTALEAGVPLVPAAVRGTEGWRRLRRWTIAFGPPVPLHVPARAEPERAAPEATRRLWQAIGELEAALDAEPA